MKTLQLIQKHYSLLEQAEQSVDQSVDATEQQPRKTIPLTTAGEKALIELLLQAFEHTPTAKDLQALDEIRQNYDGSNPKEVTAIISQLLSSAESNISTSELLGKTES